MNNQLAQVFHKHIPKDAIVEEGSILFILDPEPLNQQDFMFVFERNSHCILYHKNIKIDKDPIQILINHSGFQTYYERIMCLNNIVDMYVEKAQKVLDFLFVSKKRLFEIDGLGYCFDEYPHINKATLTLDGVYVKGLTKCYSPKKLTENYIDLILHTVNNEIENTNIVNAYKKVFTFYKSEKSDFELNTDENSLEFLVDVLKLSDIEDINRRALIIGALTSAAAHFVHNGYPDSYNIIIKKLFDIEKSICYKYISKEELETLRQKDEFLYFHLTCRIPNQYSIALFDMFLVEENSDRRQLLEKRLNIFISYLTNKIEQLINEPQNNIWEFKRSQEIGAIYGSIGQIILYKYIMRNSSQFFLEDAEAYIKKSIIYANPNERDRNVNYYIQYNLTKIVRNLETEKISKNSKQFINAAKEIAPRFIQKEQYDPFDVLVAASIAAVSTFVSGKDAVKNVMRILNLDWKKVKNLIAENSVYAASVVPAYLSLIPNDCNGIAAVMNKLLAASLQKLIESSSAIMNLIAVKLILCHSVYLIDTNNAMAIEKIQRYKKLIEVRLQFNALKNEYIKFLDKCTDRNATKEDALVLMYTIPY